MSRNGLFLGVRNVSYGHRGVKRISTPHMVILDGTRRKGACFVSLVGDPEVG